MKLPINVRDLGAKGFSSLAETTRSAIAALESLGYKREHLEISADQEVFYDPELSTIDGWLKAMNTDCKP